MKKLFIAFLLYVVTPISVFSNRSGLTCIFKRKHKFDPIEVDAHYLDARCELCRTELRDAKSSTEYIHLLQMLNIEVSNDGYTADILFRAGDGLHAVRVMTHKAMKRMLK